MNSTAIKFAIVIAIAIVSYQNYCSPASDVPARQHLRSSSRRLLVINRVIDSAPLWLARRSGTLGSTIYVTHPLAETASFTL